VIYATVAKVIDSTAIIIAAGADNGVREGMEFVIYDLSETIRDPESGEDLGRLELVKGRVFAEHVQDKMTVARTRPTQTSYSSRVMSIEDFHRAAIAAALSAPTREQLKIAGSSPTSPETDRTVRVGDNVRSVYQPEFAFTESAK
jgi:hypothetical protein